MKRRELRRSILRAHPLRKKPAKDAAPSSTAGLALLWVAL
jgi:hypothetical protein